MVKDFQLRVEPRTAAVGSELRLFLARHEGIDARTINSVRILKRSIDARQRNIFVNLTVRVYINEEPADDAFTPIIYNNVSEAQPVVVVGEGPGGLFAALRLIELGLRPIVLERGKDVHSRKTDLANITRTHNVDPESNYSFGEGGAGAYSDGKLYTRSKKRGSVDRILSIFCQHGADTSILADAHPHIGTDKLPRVIENMRNTIIRCGGEVRHETKMVSLIIDKLDNIDIVENVERVENIVNTQKVCLGVRAVHLPTGKEMEFRGPVILATGHSARDVYRYLDAAGVEIEAKGIAVGVRLEHPAELIDQIQYHNKKGRGQWLPAAEYSYVTQADGRGVYSFCMCPGGFVVPAATGKQQVVVNGMSPSHRNGRWSNSGMVVETRPEDIPGDSRLKMMLWQEELEKQCWEQGGMRQTAPAQRMLDFCRGHESHDLPRSSYAPGVVPSPLHRWLPQHIAPRLKQGFEWFGRDGRGFLTNDALMIAIETRTSAPVRITRSRDTLMHTAVQGLFPCGEGAGYAGGIVSAAIDGECCADMAKQYVEAEN